MKFFLSKFNFIITAIKRIPHLYEEKKSCWRTETAPTKKKLEAGNKRNSSILFLFLLLSIEIQPSRTIVSLFRLVLA